ncbi:hypothetical protein [Tautonia marina]|uniref:hypothetical protein n=1 Tax=Tautonia marina TaxID=2653855 RepID=UPI001F3C0BDE|nr:hypothetical protein [Tautonia marina]
MIPTARDPSSETLDPVPLDMTPDAQWPFADPPDTAVFTLDRVLDGETPVLLVTHDADDESWQFLDGEHVFEEDARVVALGEIVQLDPTLLDLADLPLGGFAWRSGPGDPWNRGEGEPPAELGDEGS